VAFVVISDFEELRLYDASLRPDPQHPGVGLIFSYRYTDYLASEALANLWTLAREAVRAGALEALLKHSAKDKRHRVLVDQAFLADLSGWREQLAKSVYKLHPALEASDLNSAVQVMLDRLIFIRLAEDRRVWPARQLHNLADSWQAGKRRSLAEALSALFREVNRQLDGEIFLPHPSEQLTWDETLLARIIHELYPPNSPY